MCSNRTPTTIPKSHDSSIPHLEPVAFEYTILSGLYMPFNPNLPTVEYNVMNSRGTIPISTQEIRYRLVFFQKVVNRMLSEISHYPDHEQLVLLLSSGTFLTVDGEQYVVFESLSHEQLQHCLLHVIAMYSLPQLDVPLNGISKTGEESREDVFKRKRQPKGNREPQRKSVRNRSFPAHRVRFRYTNWVLVDEESHKLEMHCLSSSEESDADESDSKDYCSTESSKIHMHSKRKHLRKSFHKTHSTVPEKTAMLTQLPNLSNDDGYLSKNSSPGISGLKHSKSARRRQHVRKVRRAVAEALRKKRLSSSDTEEDLVVVVHNISD